MAARKKPAAPPRRRASARRELPEERDLRRFVAKSQLEQLKRFTASYRGGVPTRTSETWPTSTGLRFNQIDERGQQMSARDRAYQAYKDNPVARTLVQTEADNVIGDGLNYQPTSDSEEWNREAKDKYYEWLENASVRGPDVHTGCELQRFLWERSRVAGDLGWILVAQGTADRLESRVQIIRSENITTPDTLWTDPDVYDGIRYDALGRPRTFYVLTHDERGVSRRWEPIPARDFVYLAHMTDPQQARGETCYITIFDLLSHLDRYIDGVSLAAWMATVFGLVIKQTNPGQMLGALGTARNSNAELQKAIRLENGMVRIMGADGEVAQVQAHQPMQQTPDFIRAMFRMLGQPFDMPLEVIAKDMSTCTFASARIGLLPFYRSCRIKAARFASRWSRTIRWWLARESHRPDGDPKKWTTAFPANYFDHELLVNAWDYTDPVSEAQADLLQIDMGTKTTPMVIAERGRDAEQILRERKEWMEKTKDLPTINSTMTRHPQSGVGATGDPLGHEQVEPPQQQEPREETNGNSNGDGREDVVRNQPRR